MASSSTRLRVDVDSNFENIRDDLGKFRGRIGEVEDENSKDIAEFFARAIRRTIRSKLFWRGKMLDSVKVRPKHRGFGDYAVTINAPIQGRAGDYGAWHEYADRGHFVEVSQDNFPINVWAKSRGIPEGSVIRVEPTSFMNESVRQASRRMRAYLNKGGKMGELLKRQFRG